MNETATGPGIAASALTAPIQKKWDELTEGEKIETLRREMMQNSYLIRRVSSLENQINNLKSHTHDQLGQTCVPVHLVNNDGGMMASRSFDPLA